MGEVSKQLKLLCDDLKIKPLNLKRDIIAREKRRLDKAPDMTENESFIEEFIQKKQEEITKPIPDLPLTNCHKCTLLDKKWFEPWNYSKNFEGDKADVLFVGQALGKTEQEEKETFVGKAGKLIKEDILKDFKFKWVFYNTCQCYPDDDREPTKDEIKNCAENLDAIIEYFNPKIIIPLGNVAMYRLIKKKKMIDSHGKDFKYKGYLVIPTYHPSSINRGQPQNKNYIISDLEYIKDILLEKNPKEIKGYKLINTIKELDEYFDILLKVDKFAFDIETTGLKQWKNEMIGISFSWEQGKAIYIPLLINANDVMTRFKEFSGEIKEDKMYPYWIPPFQDYAIDKIKAILRSDAKKYAHNAKFDIKNVKFHQNIWVKNLHFDTMIAHYLIDENPKHNLESIVDLKYPDLRGYKRPTNDIITKQKEEEKDFGKIPLKYLWKRGCIDSDATFRLSEDLLKEIKNEKTMKLLTKFYTPLIYIYADAELIGIDVDKEQAEKVKQKYLKETEVLKKEIFKEIGEEINLNSSQQLRKVLFEKLKCPIIKKTDKGAPSVDREVMRILAQDKGYKFCEKIREFTSKSGKISKIEGYVKDLDENDKGYYDYYFLETGSRFATTKKSGISILTVDKINEIRGIFTALEGYKFIIADYSQLELRVLAWLSQDPNLLKDFEDKIDPHQKSASRIFEIPENEVTEKQRDRGKMCNFAKPYGGSDETIRKQINTELAAGEIPISLKQVEKHREYWDNRYGASEVYLRNIVKIAYEKKELTTVFGHKRRFKESDELLRKDNKIKRHFENEARNFPIQSTASTVCKIAEIKLYKSFVKQKFKSRFLFSMHDAIITISPDDEVKRASELIRDTMERVVNFPGIDLLVEVKVQQRWGKI